MSARTQHRLLTIDDNPAIHEDFQKLFAARPPGDTAFDIFEAEFLGSRTQSAAAQTFELDSASQGQEGLEKVTAALAAGRPYTVAFVDVRMPPGWDGVETIERLWKVDPTLQVVICTAYSDYSWDEVRQRLGNSDSLLVLKKPFDTVEVLQIAHTLTRKWELTRQARLSIAELDRKVAVRTEALEREMAERARIEENLRQSQKMEAVGQLAAGVAHDFNNLLTIIQGHVGLLLSTPRGAKKTERSLTQVSLAADRAAALVRQLLLFSRKETVQQKPIDLNQLLIKADSFLHRVIGEQIKLRIEPGVEPVCVMADECNLEQVVMNLAVNARDAMEGGGVLTMRTSIETLGPEGARVRPHAQVGRFACLTVTDTGCGMDAATLNRIFEPFFTTKKIGKGTGLGLSTVYGIVQHHHGWIEVSSQLDHGTTFNVYLPLRASAVLDVDPADCLVISQPQSPEHPTVLVVEDDLDVRQFVSTVLKMNSYRVLEAVDGVHALEIRSRHSGVVDLLFTDMVMPNGLTGRDLAEKLRQESPQLKVIFSSGYSPESIGESWLSSPGVGFLPKPYSAEALLKAVSSCGVSQAGQRAA